MRCHSLAASALFLLAWVGCQSPGGTTPLETLARQRQSVASTPPPQMEAGGAFLTGAYLEFAGDPVGASAQYQVAAALDSDEYLSTKQMQAEFALGKWGEPFVQQAQKLTLLYPNSVPLHLLLAQIWDSLSKEDAAIGAYEKVLKMDSQSLEAYKRLIVLHQKRKEDKKALALAVTFSKKMPHSELAWLTLTQLYLLAQQPKAAIAALEKFYVLQPQQLDTTAFYAYLLDQYGYPARYKEVIQSLYAEEIPIEAFGDRTLAFFKLYRNVDPILKRFTGLLAPSEKGYVELQLQQVFLLWEKGNAGAALTLVQSLLPRYESDRTLFLLGLAHEKAGQLEAAEAAYQRVEKNTKYFLFARQQWIQLCVRQKKFEQAILLAEALLQYPFVNWEIYPYVASVYADQKQYDRSITLLKTGYQRYPSKTELLFLQGVYEDKKGDQSASIACMEELLQVDPLESRAWNFIGYSLAESGRDLDRAEQYVRRALELKPSDGYYLDSLGWIYYKRQDFAKALEYLQAAVKAEPEESLMYEHLGDAYRELHQLSEALKAYQQANQYLTEENEKQRLLQKMYLVSPPTGAI